MSTTYSDLPYSNFPEAQEDLVVYQNVNSTSKPIVDHYLELVGAGNFNEAQTYYNANKNVLDKIIINENTINKLLQSIIAVERMFSNDVTEYINRSTGNLVPIEIVDVLPSSTEIGKLYFVLEPTS